MDKLKYVKGKVIQSLDELMVQEFIIFQNKVYHKGWFAGWQIAWVDYRIKSGQMFQVVQRPVCYSVDENHVPLCNGKPESPKHDCRNCYLFKGLVLD